MNSCDFEFNGVNRINQRKTIKVDMNILSRFIHIARVGVLRRRQTICMLHNRP